MKILFLSRPVSNGGDFLFSERAKEILAANLPKAQIMVKHVLDEMSLKFINSFDKVVIAGGPMYDNRFLSREALPLFRNLENIHPSIHFFCNGFYGNSINKNYIYIYNFYDNIINDLKLIEAKGGSFSCRDYITETVLRNNGLNRVYMTGCSAWYDLDKMRNSQLKPLNFQNVHKVIISDQGLTKNCQWHDVKFDQTKELVDFVKARFDKAEIIFTFNGGIDTKYSGKFNRRICEYLMELGIEYKDLSGNMKGFCIYNDADLHIGYRVHSHIYALSQRIPSILIEEDARGGGVNQALGLPDIQNYRCNEEEGFISNPYMLSELDYYLKELEREHCSRLQAAIKRMQDVYQNVTVPYIQNVIGRGM